MICTRCKGSGWLFRPKPEKFLNFKKCTDCGGHGTKPAPRKSDMLIGPGSRKPEQSN